MVLTSGCAVITPPDAAELIQQSTGTESAIEYRAVGEPADVTDELGTALTLSDAVAMSLRHGPEIQAALARVRAAQADAQQTRLLPNPVLSIAVRFPEPGGSPTIEAGIAGELLSLLQRPRQISAADHRLRAASADALTAALDTVAEVQSGYVAVQGLDAQLHALTEQIELVHRLLDVARSRVQAGESSSLDVLTLDAERIRIESELLDTQAGRRDERLALARLLGRPSNPAEWTLTPYQTPELPNADEALCIAAALENRPEVQAQRWELAALGDEVALTGWTPAEGSEVGAEAERDEGTWSVGPAVAVPLPLFDWGQSRRERIAAQQVEARHKLVQMQRQVIEDVRRALASLEMSQKSLDKVRLELIPVLERRHEQASEAYRIGEADGTSVLLAEQELLEARSRRIALESRVAMAHAKLLRAVGGAGIAETLAPSTRPVAGSTQGN